jgi:dTDP-4-dehydrorhamnose 3,5-epimerase
MYQRIPSGGCVVELSCEKTFIEDVVVVKPQVFRDERGFFSEIYREDQFKTMGLPCKYVQMNHSGSVKSVTRGIHFQWDPPMGKLMRVTVGKAFLVAVDIRKGSPTLGRWYGAELSSESSNQIWAPAGFARGFCVLSDFAEIQYLCTGVYTKNNGESGIRWDDPEIGINWPVQNPILSKKDQTAQTLREWLQRPESDNFTYGFWWPGAPDMLVPCWYLNFSSVVMKLT